MSRMFCTICDDYGHGAEDHVKEESTNEDRYEAFEVIIKCRQDGKSWFDIFFDLVTEDCEGDPESEENTCTCGLESAGGTTGTLDQCYRNHGIADDLVGPVNKDDLLRILSTFEAITPEDQAAYNRLYNECTWWEETLEKWSENDDEEEIDQDYPGGDEGDCRGLAD